MKPELLFYCGASLLEGPVWNRRLEKLLFVSIEQGIVYLFNPFCGEVSSFNLGSQVGCAVFESDNMILAAAYKGLCRINIHTGEKEVVTNLLEDKGIRYNDGTLDARGRFLVGTTGYNCLAEGKNFLYSWDGHKKSILLSGTTISNGVDFSPDGKYMYFVDTPTKKVGKYAYNVEDGTVRFERYVIEIQGEGVPDGICVEAGGDIWVAEWGGGRVSKWNAETGEKLDEILLPCKNVSSCCFGGKNGETMYITTAKHDDGTVSEPMAGGLFCMEYRG